MRRLPRFPPPGFVSRFPLCYTLSMPQAHIGCSGFNYPHWKGVFYSLDELPVTADFVYFRRHGAVRGYTYSDKELGRGAARIRDHLQQGRDVSLYFNNDAYGYASRNAQTLKGMLP